MSTTVTALDAGNITEIGIGVIVALVVIGFLISLVITAIVGRLIIAVIVIALGVFVWQQRSSVEHKIDSYRRDACNFNATFFGVHLDPPDSLRKACLGDKGNRAGHRRRHR